MSENKNSGLVVMKNQIRQNLELNELAFVKRSMGLTKIRDLDIQQFGIRNTLETALTDAILELELFMKPREETSPIVVRDICGMILRDFKSLSVDEVYYALKMERYDGYEAKNGFYGVITTQYVAQILNNYKNHKKKLMINNNITMGKTNPVDEVNDEEKEMIILTGILDTFEMINEQGRIVVLDKCMDGRSWVYDYLVDEKKIFEFSKDEKMQFYDKAKEVLNEHIRGNKGLMKKSALDLLLSEIEEKKSGKVITLAKKLCLVEIAYRLKKEGKEIKDFL